jgi:phosphatidate cytidylyltransferase
MVWCNDTFAYFAGRWLGRHKLFERISPKKTWEGFFGGLVMSVLCGVVLHQVYPDAMFNVLYPGAHMSLIDWMGLGVVVSVAGTFGDLAESLLKRSIDIKDSGSILPGHGGFLDRFDGFLLAVPCAVVYLYFFG